MLRKLWRIVPAALAAQGAGMIWLARCGALWRYNDLSWFAPVVLRPGLVLVGAAALVMGLWYAWLAYATAGRVLGQWVDDAAHDLAAGAVADLGWRAVVRSYSRELWRRRGCMIGRHDPAAVLYIPREGDVCEHCGLAVRMRLSWADRVDSCIAGRAPRLWTWLHRKEIARGDWLPGDYGAHGEPDVKAPDELVSVVATGDTLYVLGTQPSFEFGDEHYPGLVPVPVEDCDCSRCEYLRKLATVIEED